MGDGCTCDDPSLVTIKDMNLTLPYVSGNAYSRYCQTCGRRYFCKKSFWKRAAEKFVIPKNEDEPIHVDDFDERDGCNFFECPQCDEPHFGQPDDCECGADYQWE